MIEFIATRGKKNINQIVLKQIQTMHYNTTSLKGNDLKVKKEKNESQEVRIYNFFKNNKTASYKPNFINFMVFDNSAPLTSVRRALSDLTSKGLLIKTDVKAKGLYGEFVHTWKYNNENK